MSTNPGTGEVALIEEYRKIVLDYEAVGEEISALLEANDGGTQKMSDDEYMRYRQLAERRDTLYDAMKHLEVRLLGEDPT